MTKVAFICHDGLSTLNFCRWFAAEFRDRPDVAFYTISSRDIYGAEVDALGSHHIDITTDRFIDPVRDLLYLARLYRACRRERFDVVVTLGTKPNIFGPVAAKLAGTRRIILSVRGLGRTFNDAPSLSGRVLKATTRALYQLACRCADRIWFTNNVDRDYVLAEGIAEPSQAFLTANSVDPDYFSMAAVPEALRRDIRASLGIGPNDVVVIMVARMIWLKGIREFVEAARAVRETRPHVRFVLVAPLEPGSPEEVPVDYMNDAVRSGAVSWLEFRKDIREMYAMADIAVLPSYYKEGGYPRALLEPMSLGRPIIGADTPECRGPVEPEGNGYLVPPRDAAALARAVERLVDDPERRKQFGSRSRTLVLERFADRIVGEQVLSEIGVAPARGRG